MFFGDDLYKIMIDANGCKAYFRYEVYKVTI